MRHIALAIGMAFAICCSNKVKKGSTVLQVNDTAITCVIAALNITQNEYRCITAQRIIRDTMKQITVDTVDGQIIQEIRPQRDTIYFAWWGLNVPDSTGKAPRKNYLGQDSIVFRFIPLQKEMVIHDYNRRFR